MNSLIGSHGLKSCERNFLTSKLGRTAVSTYRAILMLINEILFYNRFRIYQFKANVITYELCYKPLFSGRRNCHSWGTYILLMILYVAFSEHFTCIYLLTLENYFDLQLCANKPCCKPGHIADLFRNFHYQHIKYGARPYSFEFTAYMK